MPDNTDLGPYYSPLPAPFSGVDRAEFLTNARQIMRPAPKGSKKKGADQLQMTREAHDKGEVWKENPMIKWMDTLYKKSTFESTGVYLTSDPIPPHTDKDYASPTNHVSNGWTDNFTGIMKMGWAPLLLYEGFTGGKFKVRMLPVDPPLNSPGAAKAYGKMHAEQIKMIVAKFGESRVGSVVYIVNEVNAITSALEEYYQSVFDEMKTQAPEPGAPPPVRAGFYARDDNSLKMLKKNPDLFVWFITGGNWRKPFSSSYPKLEYDLETFSTWMYHRGPMDIMLPVGDQSYMNYKGVSGSIPPPDSKLISETFSKLRGWDFNSSLVRDPCFPEAYPRFCIRKSVVIRGLWNRDQHAMSVDEFLGPGSNSIGGALVEPEAPLVATDKMEIFTLSTQGSLLTSNQLSPGKWSKLVAFAGESGYTVRQIRAMGVVSLGESDVQLFFIGRDQDIYGIRRKGPTIQSRWTDIRRVGVKTHPFGQLTVGSIDGKSVDVVSMGLNHRLQVARWDGSAKAWPEGKVTVINSEKALFPGSALALVAPSKNQHVVFAINDQRKICMASADSAGTWSAMEEIDFKGGNPIFPHSKLAAVRVDDTNVQIAAITHSAIPCVYTMQLGSKGWFLVGDIRLLNYYPDANPKGWDAEGLPPGQRAMLEQKMGRWQVNPFGDMALTNEPEGITLTCALCAPAQVGLGRRRVNRPQERWYRLPEDAADLIRRAMKGGG